MLLEGANLNNPALQCGVRHVRGMKLAARVTLAMMFVTVRRERGDCAIMYITP